MAHYRVRAGKQLPRHGELIPGGTVVSLEPDVAAHPSVAHYVDWVDDIDDLPRPVIVPGAPQQGTPVLMWPSLPMLEPEPIPAHDEPTMTRLEDTAFVASDDHSSKE